MSRPVSGLASAALISLAFSLPAAAATLTESGDFSSNWSEPTAVPAGTTAISGTASDLDVLMLTGLTAGAQEIDFTFSGESIYTSGNLTAGGTILWSATPFEWAWDQDGSTGYQVSYNSWNLGTPWYGSSGALTSTSTLYLPADYAGGALYLAIVPWNSTALTYTIDLPVSAVPAPTTPPAPVPLPAAGLLMVGALGGLAALARKRARV